MKRMFLVIIVLVIATSNVWSDDDSYYYVVAMSHENGLQVIISDIVAGDFLDADIDISSQFMDWMEAYAKRLTGTEYYEFDEMVLGGYDSESEAEQDKREDIGDYTSDDWEVFDIPRRPIPAFRYYRD